MLQARHEDLDGFPAPTPKEEPEEQGGVRLSPRQEDVWNVLARQSSLTNEPRVSGSKTMWTAIEKDTQR